MSIRGRSSALVVSIAVCATAVGAWVWLKQQHVPTRQLEVAENFVSLIRTRRLSEAYELTMKARMELPTTEPFEMFAPRQVCGSFALVEIFPFQSNGNHIRRRLLGRNPEMEEVNVQYYGECAFRVTVRRGKDGDWKVYKFGSHAW
jgi:hypothetical protein